MWFLSSNVHNAYVCKYPITTFIKIPHCAVTHTHIEAHIARCGHLQSRADPPSDQAWLPDFFAKMRIEFVFIVPIFLLSSLCVTLTQGQSKGKSIIEYLGTTYIMPDGCPSPNCNPNQKECRQTIRYYNVYIFKSRAFRWISFFLRSHDSFCVLWLLYSVTCKN